MAPAMIAAAERLNSINIAMTEKLPKEAAYAAGSLEGLFGWWEKLSGMWKSVVSSLVFIIKWPGRAWKVTKGIFGGILKGGKKVIEWGGKGGKALASMWETARLRGMFFMDWLKKLGPKITGVGKTVGTKLLGPLKTLFGFLKGLAPKFLGSMGKLAKFGKTNPVTIALFGMIEGFMKVHAAAGDFADYIGGGLLGALGAFAELGDFIFGGFIGSIGRMFGVDLGDTGLINMIGIGINKLIGGVEMGFQEAWAKLQWGDIGETFVYMFDEAWKAVKDFLGISSPSKLFMEIGTNIIDSITGALDPQLLIDAATFMITAFIEPWKSLGSLLMEIIQPAMDLIPDSVKNLFFGDSKDTAGKLSNQATSGPVSAAMATTNAAGGVKEPQVIHISLNLDGKQIDKKIINVVGGVVKQAVQ
jgi:hypothetical protein